MHVVLNTYVCMYIACKYFIFLWLEQKHNLFDRLWHLCSLANGAWLVHSVGTPLTMEVVVVSLIILKVCV